MYYADFPIEEHLHKLLPNEIERLEQFSHIKRKREFVATRILRSTIFGKRAINYSEIGAPFLSEKEYISISHASNVVGIGFSEKHAVGLDLEPIREKVHRIKDKFLSSNEHETLNTSSTEELIKVWSAKEALYKLAKRKKIIFATELHLQKIDEINWKGTILNTNHKKEVFLNIITHKDFVISFNIYAPNDYY
ncbi:MAG: 4'-phosphopantetheinyl transferase family protein [Lishizhenia sp.]